MYRWVDGSKRFNKPQRKEAELLKEDVTKMV